MKMLKKGLVIVSGNVVYFMFVVWLAWPVSMMSSRCRGWIDNGKSTNSRNSKKTKVKLPIKHPNVAHTVKKTIQDQMKIVIS